MYSKAFLDKVKEHERAWQQERQRRHGDQEFKATTFSGIPIKPVYTPADIKDTDYHQIGMPGVFPLIR